MISTPLSKKSVRKKPFREFTNLLMRGIEIEKPITFGGESGLCRKAKWGLTSSIRPADRREVPSFVQNHESVLREDWFFVPTLRVQVVRSWNRSRIKSGMTINGYSEKARFRSSDKAPGRNLDTIASRLSSVNGEPVCLIFRDLRPISLDFSTHNSHWNLQLILAHSNHRPAIPTTPFESFNSS